MKPSEVERYINKNITVTQKNGLKIHGVLVANILSSNDRPPAIDIIDRRHGEIEGKKASHKVTHYITQRVYVCNIRSITTTPTEAEGAITDELLNAYRAKTAHRATKAIL